MEAVASSATSVDAAATATAAIREKTKVAVLERRAGARAQTLARIRGSEASDVLRSPEPGMPELEISWISEEREEQEEEECGKKLELDLEPPLPEPKEKQECQLPSQQGFTVLVPSAYQETMMQHILSVFVVVANFCARYFSIWMY